MRECVVALTVACAVVAACGETARVEWARPQTIAFASGSDCGTAPHRLAITVRRLVVGRGSWRVDATIVNRTGAPVAVGRPHHRDRVRFGLVVLDSPSRSEVEARADRQALYTGPVAERVVPPLPRALAAGERWSGWFSAPGRLPRAAWVRVVFGRFTIPGRVPPGLAPAFSCVSDAARRV